MLRLVLVLSSTCLVACSSGSDPGGGTPGGTGGSSATATPEGGGGGDTWSTFAQGFFSTYCVSCHDGTMTNITGDFRSSAQVMQHQADIRCGVATTVLKGCESSKWPPRQFPAGNGAKPSDAERMRLVAWIDAGLPE